MEELFSEVSILEKWWNNGVITLEDYLKIKSNLVDFHMKNYEDGDDLPF